MVVKVDSFIRSFDNVTKSMITKLKDWVDKSLEVRKEYAERISPTDTWEYIRWHNIEQARLQWDRIIGANINHAKDAFIVEFWARKEPVNRHKWPPRTSSTVIYRWVGANVYQRTNFDTKEQVENILARSI